MGVLCDEKRRGCFAAELLKLMGHGAELDAHLAKAAADSMGAVATAAAPPQPADDLDRLVLKTLRARAADGSLAAEAKVWRLEGAPLRKELLLLATVAAGETKANPVLSKARTPWLFAEMRDRVFVGFAHALLVESAVSRLAMLEKRHPRTHALTLDNTFNYHMRMAEARAARLDASARSTTGGALRAASVEKIGKALKGTNRSKVQQLMLIKDALARAASYDSKRLFKRGEDGVAQTVKRQREEYKVTARDGS
jgi:hypothetical protein